MRGVPSVTTSAANLLKITHEEVNEMFGTMEALNPSSYEGKAQLVTWYEDLYTLLDALGLCKFGYRWPIVPLKFDHFARLFSLVTGVEMTGREIRESALRRAPGTSTASREPSSASDRRSRNSVRL